MTHRSRGNEMQMLASRQCVHAAASRLVRPVARRSTPSLARAASHATSSSSSSVSSSSRSSAGSGAGKTKLVIVDGHNVAFRAYWALTKGATAPSTADGIPTAVTFGFLKWLLSLLKAEQPDSLFLCFDERNSNSFRRQLLPSYKSSRSQQAPPGFAHDFRNLQLLLRHLRLPILRAIEGQPAEGDDVIAAAAAQASANGFAVRVVSTDRDLFQVVDDAADVAVLLPGNMTLARAGDCLIDEAAVAAELGLPPALVPDYKALVGDASDDIPGVRGIGPKTAVPLLTAWGSVEGVFANIDSLKPSIADKLRGQQDTVALYKVVATVRRDAVGCIDLQRGRLSGFCRSEVEPLLRRLEMTHFISRSLPRFQELCGGNAAARPDLAPGRALMQLADNGHADPAASDDSPPEAAAAAESAAAVVAAPATEAAVETAAAAAAETAAAAAEVAAAVDGSSSSSSSLLPDALQSALPTVLLVENQQQLQQLLDQLLLPHRGQVSWAWPQHSPYTPEAAAPAPAAICCTWDAEPALPASRRRRRTSRTASSSASSSDGISSAPVVLPDGTAAGAATRLAVIVPGQGLEFSVVLDMLRPLLEDASRPKALFESQRCYSELAHWAGLELAGVEFDVLVAAHLLNPEPDKRHPAAFVSQLNTSLTEMAAALASAAAPAGKAAAAASLPQLPAAAARQEAVWTAAAESWAVHLLRGRLLPQLQQAGAEPLLRDIELPLQQVLSNMERLGIRCSREVLEAQQQALQADAAQLEAQLFEIAGEAFNLKSRRTLSRVLYDKLQLDAGIKVAVTKSGFKSTSQANIEALPDSPFKQAYLAWATLDGLLTKNYTPYLGSITQTGRIHTVYDQVGAVTGRITSHRPNLQAVPAHNERGKQVRAAFLPSEGHVLVSADYSQVELRVVAGLAGDAALLEAFRGGVDVHEATARDLLGKAPGEPVTAAERQMGKRVNFGVLYGLGARQLAADIGITQAEAKTFLERFQAAHAALLAFQTQCVRSAVGLGYTHSALGRRRQYSFQAEQLRSLLGSSQQLEQLPELAQIKKLAKRDDAAVLRQAGNAPIQGTSADIIKAAMVQLHRELAGAPFNSRLLLTVHDEVVLEVPRQVWPAVRGEVVRIMEGVLGDRFLLKVDVHHGDSWLDCK